MNAPTKNVTGRWEVDGYELTSGRAVEVFIANQWLPGHLEWDNDRGEYIVLLAGGGTLLINTELRIRLPLPR